jgi:hypothetical protein
MNRETDGTPVVSIDRENELLCEQLLGWKRVPHRDAGGARWRCPASSPIGTCRTPLFLTGNDMLLLLEALQRRGLMIEMHAAGACSCRIGPGDHFRDPELPAAVRAAALAYLGTIHR